MSFEDFNFHPDLLDSILSMGFNTPTPIQVQAIPCVLAGKDLIACAQTGTGKTAAYLLPALQNLASTPEIRDQVHSLIVVPTRELALQIDQQIQGFGYFLSVSSFPVYGGGKGEDFMAAKKALTTGAEIIVATPGSLISHLNLGYVKLDHLKHFVLDEADRMLDMGFVDDIMKIASFTPASRQTLLFSATMPEKIRKLSLKLLRDPAEISIAISKPSEKVIQAAFHVYDQQKINVIEFLLKDDDMPSVVIFSSTKRGVDEIVKSLKRAGKSVRGLHSDLEQSEREEVIRMFKNEEIGVLVATDIVARGIDIDTISMVINYNVPPDPEDYIHRIGRTARAKRDGEAVTLVNPDDQYRFNRLEEFLEKPIRTALLPNSIGELPIYDPKKLGSRKKSYSGSPKKKPYGSSSKGYHKKKWYILLKMIEVSFEKLEEAVEFQVTRKWNYSKAYSGGSIHGLKYP